jgi:hypothetical protein
MNAPVYVSWGFVFVSFHDTQVVLLCHVYCFEKL